VNHLAATPKRLDSLLGRRCLVALAAAVAVATSLVATPAALAGEIPEMHRRSVHALLMSPRGFPTKAQVWRTGKLEDTNRILTELAADSRANIVLQLNAVRALEYFPSKKTEEVLMTLLYSRGQSPAHKRAILRSLARTFGVRMYFEILPFLRDYEPTIRAGAAVAIAEIDDGRVKSLLMNLLETEPEIEVRLAAERGLVILEDREKAAAGKVNTEFESQDLVDPLRLDNDVVIEPDLRAERPRRPRPADRPQ
jgi:HEAT repeats